MNYCVEVAYEMFYAISSEERQWTLMNLLSASS